MYSFINNSMCKRKAYLSNNKNDFFPNTAFHMRPYFSSLSFSSFPLPVFSSFVRCFLSLSFSRRMKFLRTFVAKRESAFIDRSQNDLAHVSYSSWRSGVGGLDFPSSSRAISSLFSARRGAARRNATRRDATQCGQHPSIAAAPRTALALAVVDSCTRLIDELFLPCRASKATHGVARSVGYFFFHNAINRSLDQSSCWSLLIKSR